MTELTWLPEYPDWRPALKLVKQGGPEGAAQLRRLAATRLDFIRTNALDTALAAYPALGLAGKPIRLGVLSSCTVKQLHPAIRIAGLRHDIPLSLYQGEYGQYWQELSDTTSGLHAFKPNTILFTLDAHHLAAGLTAGMSAADVDEALAALQARLQDCWRLAQAHFGAHVIQQTPLPLHPALLGNNEHRLPGSKAAFIARFTESLRPLADSAGVDLLALDHRAARDGIAAWHDAGLWHHAKQEISAAAGPLYGELLLRIIAAKQGRAAKCLVLDLDNTLWGGVIGDDGLDGIVLGQGSALGEAFVSFQDYARELSRRGIILAVCSKNNEANALEPFEKHPEMLLKRGDIAYFVANWEDKASNLRAIAAGLNIGLDSLVFADDNPFERNLVRQELPMVAVPEIGDDPSYYAQIISDAGYFEGLAITEEDRERNQLYQVNRLREALKTSTTDLPSYLRSLEMELVWRKFDTLGLSRIVQLINKTNQFNLTTRRYTEADVLAIMADPRSFGLQLRLLDRFGDNGIIAIIIGRMQNETDLLIDTWLMSCRVLGRQVEATTLNLIAAQAQSLGAARLIGEYIPTKKNAMVKAHYLKLGFSPINQDGSLAALDLDSFTPAPTFIEVKEG